MKVQHISEERLKGLQQSIGWLDTLKADKDTLFVVGNTINPEDWNIPKTQLLQEIMNCNEKLESILVHPSVAQLYVVCEKAIDDLFFFEQPKRSQTKPRLRLG